MSFVRLSDQGRHSFAHRPAKRRGPVCDHLAAEVDRSPHATRGLQTPRGYYPALGSNLGIDDLPGAAGAP
jgi:hypothetical protein